MSVGLFRYDRDMLHPDAKLTFSANVASEAFYTRVWTAAVQDTGIRIFKDGSEFSPEQAETVLDELHRLMLWCDARLTGNDYYKMKSTLEDLMQKIREELPNSSENFYIF